MESVKAAPGRLIGRVVTHISLISYSVYLIHRIVIHLFLTAHYIACYKLGLPNTSAGKFIGSWVACIIVATIMYRFFEKPFTDLRERFKLKRARLDTSKT
jgi:peptidoglycan/LPS O-acetylase OafA/YrhL